MKSRFFGLGVALLAITTAACGGTVIFSPDGDGGSGGSTTSSSPTSVTSTTTSSSPTASSSTGTMGACQQLCNEHAQCLGGDCLSQCDQIYVPGCENQAEALIVCYADKLDPNCGLTGSCDNESFAYDQCVNGNSCETFGCFGGGQECGCTGQCFGAQLEQNCQVGPQGFVQCQCYGDFGFLGNCNQDFLSCELDSGCCQNLLIQPD